MYVLMVVYMTTKIEVGMILIQKWSDIFLHIQSLGVRFTGIGVDWVMAGNNLIVCITTG